MNLLIPIPTTDFDPSETAIPWKILKDHGIQITFATPNGKIASADQRMLSGQALGPLKKLFIADEKARAVYQEMTHSPEFQTPIKWQDIQEKNFNGIILSGGHAPGMKEYLESQILQKVVVDFFNAKKLVAAICHGVVLAARSQNSNGKSILFGKKTTALLRSQEFLAWGLTCLWLGNYYRTYPESVQAEVTRNLESPKDFLSGPTPFRRDSINDLKPGFVIEDGNYISSRWPGDAHNFALKIIEKLREP